MPAINTYKAILDHDSPAGLAFLNARVPHRYTGVYQLQDGQMRCMHLHDKEGEVMPEFLAVVPLRESFCQFTMRDGLFVTVDSGGDGRLDGHKYQGVLRSYVGLPLLDNRGELMGTMCHFDPRALELSDAEFELFRRAANLLPSFLRW